MIIDTLARFAAEDPRSLALVVNNVSVSYADLWRGIGVLENRLKDAAIPRGARVGVAVADLRLAWFSILALEKMGHPAFAVPQNARVSQLGLANIGAILNDGQPHGAAVLDGGAPVVNVSTGSNAPAPGLGGAFARPELERFILFSSGTTGHYKKVQLTGALRDERILRNALSRGYSPKTRHFIGSLGPWTVHGYQGPLAVWAQGGAIIVHQLPDIPAAIAAHKPDSLFVTPGLAEDWLRQMGKTRIDGRGLRISAGGGPLSASLLVALQEAFPGASIVQLYGTTECGVAAETPIATARDLEGHIIRDDTRIEIVDPEGRSLAVAAFGAIRMRNSSMVKQYLDDPAASAVFFRDGWFYPGDMGAIGYDGRLVLSGRFAEVINLRGDKVAPSVVEEPIKKALNAREVAVFSRPVPGKLDELHVFIVEGAVLTREIIERELKPLGGAFSKIGIHKSEGLPRNSMGKVLYGQLRSQLKG